jgi:hypothetical protein
VIITCERIYEKDGQHVNEQISVEVTLDDLDPMAGIAADPGAPSDTRHPLTALALDTLKAARDLMKGGV